MYMMTLQNGTVGSLYIEYNPPILQLKELKKVGIAFMFTLELVIKLLMKENDYVGRITTYKPETTKDNKKKIVCKTDQKLQHLQHSLILTWEVTKQNSNEHGIVKSTIVSKIDCSMYSSVVTAYVKSKKKYQKDKKNTRAPTTMMTKIGNIPTRFSVGIESKTFPSGIMRSGIKL